MSGDMDRQLEIRLERPEEYRQVEELTRDAFWNQHVPGCDEHYLVHILRGHPAFLPQFDFVALRGGRLVGHIMYTKAWVEDAAGAKQDVILFGPLSVLTEAQRQGIGGALIRHSVEAARAMGFRAVLIYGDPAYYSRHSFEPASRYGITPPDGTPHPALQVLPLAKDAMDGLSGRFFEDPVYDTLNPADVAAFDRGFPPREKFETASQRRFAALARGENPDVSQG